MRMIIIFNKEKEIILSTLGDKVMGYYIYAWLENGNPQLQIIDAKSKSVCVSWSYQTLSNVKTDNKKEIQRLFKDLLLLTCKQEMRNFRIFEVKPIINENISSLLDETACA